MTQHTYSELMEAERRLRAAERAQQQQIADQRAPQEAIERAQQDVNRLAAQAREESFKNIAADNDRLISEIAALHRNCIALLDAGDVRGARTLSDQANRQHAEHLHLIAQAVRAVEPEINARIDAALAAVFPEQRDAQRLTVARTARDYYARQLKAQPELPYTLIQWISETDDPQERQRRQGLTYALTGQLWNAQPGYSAAAAYAADQRVRQTRW